MAFSKGEMRVIMSGRLKGRVVRIKDIHDNDMYTVVLAGGSSQRVHKDMLGTMNQGQKLDEFVPNAPSDTEPDVVETGAALEPRSGGDSGPPATTDPVT